MADNVTGRSVSGDSPVSRSLRTPSQLSATLFTNSVVDVDQKNINISAMSRSIVLFFVFIFL